MDQQTPTVLADLPSVTAKTSGPPESMQRSEAAAKDAGSPINGPIPWAAMWAYIIGLSAVSATISLFLGRTQGPGLFIGLLCFATLLLSAGFDSATGRIPNPITYTAILLGLSLNTAGLLLPRSLAERWLGAVGPTQSLMGFLIFGGIGLVSRALAGLGGGDMKLLAAVGALLGRSQATDAMIAALAVAVVYALANLISGGRLNAVVRSISLKILSGLYPQAALPVAAHRSRTFPLAIPMFLGLLLSIMPPVAAGMAWLRGM